MQMLRPGADCLTQYIWPGSWDAIFNQLYQGLSVATTAALVPKPSWPGKEHAPSSAPPPTPGR